MESSDSIDKSWDTTSDTTTTAMRSDPLASEGQPPSTPGGWMVNIAGRDIVEMSHADVVSRWRNGELLGNCLVWREGMESWARLESVPAFQIIGKPPPEPEPPTVPEDANPVAVYERPMATLIFDEAVEDEWKGAKAREPSKAARGSEASKGTRSASARPPAPELPPLAPRRSPVVPVDEPPPPPPLPPRRSLPAGRPSARPPMPTIPGGLAPPSPRSPSVSPAKSPLPLASAAAPKTSSPPPTASPANSPIPAGPPSSPLLAAIAAAASSPEPVVVAQAPVLARAAPLLDEVSVSARLHAMKSVSLRNAVLACVGSALVASLVTGLVVGSRSRAAARRSPEPPAKVVAAAPVAPSPAPTPEPAPTPGQAPTAEVAEKASVDKVTLSDLPEKPKPKPVKVSAWKAPKPSTPTNPDSTLDGPAPNPSRDDPERAVPDRVVDRPAQPANWQADPGF
jgi:hypothetical protein